MKAQRGMTLIEVLVALVLLSMLSIGLFSAFRVGQRTYARVVRNDSASRDVLATQRLLHRLIETAYPLGARALQTRMGLEGTADEFEVTAASYDHGNERYRLFTTMRADGLKDWVVQYGLDRNGAMVTDDGDATDQRSQEILIQGVRSVEWSYLPANDTSITSSTMSSSWLPQWQHQATLPALVKVRVQFAEDDRRQWPLFFAAPVITDDALCEFDVVSQACRGSSR